MGNTGHGDALSRGYLKNVRKVHIVGIGGISMSAIAKILVQRGFVCTGSDKVPNDNCADVEKLGVQVFEGHEATNIGDQDLVIYTAAVNEGIPEIVRAKELGIPVVGRAKFLGELMEEYDNSIAIAGAHGKTSTTSMVAHILHEVLDPTTLVGGLLHDNHSNVFIGESDTFVHEACEFKDTFLSLRPRTAVILNIDEDHLDYFSGLDAIVASFEKFAESAKELIVYNIDDEHVRRAVAGLQRASADASGRAKESRGLPNGGAGGSGGKGECRESSSASDAAGGSCCLPNEDISGGKCECCESEVAPRPVRLVSFGQHEDADYRVVHLQKTPDAKAKFTILRKGEKPVDIALHAHGFINWANAAAAFSCCCEVLMKAGGDPAVRAAVAQACAQGGISPAGAQDPAISRMHDDASCASDIGAGALPTDASYSASVAELIRLRLEDFENADRRFQIYGTYRGITIVDDFAHHPNEIKPAMETAKAVSRGRVIALFQPYTFSRTKELLDDFGSCFLDVDELVLSDILGGREIDPGDIHSRDVVRVASALGIRAHLSDTLEHAGDLAISLARPGDMIITVGCGNVYLAARYMEQQLKKE